MKVNQGYKLWNRFGMNRREFLRHFGIATGAITLSPFMGVMITQV